MPPHTLNVVVCSDSKYVLLSFKWRFQSNQCFSILICSLIDPTAARIISNSQPPYPSKGIRFVQGMRNALVNNMPKNWDYGAYANYDEDDFTTVQWQQQYFGDHYPRLVTIKTKL